MSFIDDKWLKDHDSIDELAIELMHKINQRNQYPTNTSAYAKSDLYIKALFRKLQKLIYCLQIDLKALSDSNKLTQRERDRRQRMINSLQDRSKNIEIKLQNPLISTRNDLFKKSEKVYPNERTPYSINSNEEEESKQSVSGLREAQRVMIDEQERNLDTLTEIVQRQKSLALGIDAEITVQNEILEDVGTSIEDSRERLLRNTRNINLVDRKSNTCGYWTVIILLLIAIVVVSLVPN